MKKQLSVEGMMCQNCVKHVKKALEQSRAQRMLLSAWKTRQQLSVCRNPLQMKSSLPLLQKKDMK